jgi:hypothetical protein
MVRKLSIFIFVTVILAPVLFAHAQQPEKVPRIGYLTFAQRHSGRVCAGLGTSRAKTLSLSGDRQRENSIASPPLRPSWCVLR